MRSKVTFNSWSLLCASTTTAKTIKTLHSMNLWGPRLNSWFLNPPLCLYHSCKDTATIDERMYEVWGNINIHDSWPLLCAFLPSYKDCNNQWTMRSKVTSLDPPPCLHHSCRDTVTINERMRSEVTSLNPPLCLYHSCRDTVTINERMRYRVTFMIFQPFLTFYHSCKDH